MTAIVSADVPLQRVQEELARHDQWLPIDGDPARTVGELVEFNSSGPLRLGYGAWRDLLLGVQFTNGRNELITAGGRTVKNVAGYDLTKFMVGQRRIFGRLATITTRTYRRPAGAVLAIFPPDVARLNEMISSAQRPQWSILTTDALQCGYLGDEQTLAYYESSLPSHNPREITRRTLQEEISHRDQLWRPPGGRNAIFRAAVPPTAILDFAHRASLTAWVADAAFGIVLGPTLPSESGDEHDAQEQIHAAAKAVGGSVFFETLGSHCDHFPGEVEDQLLQALKTAFDPDNNLEAL